MNKQSAVQRTSKQKKTFAVGALAAALAVVNVVPLHYSSRQQCPSGGSYTISGVTMGLPAAYYRTEHGGLYDCAGFAGTSSTGGFSAQALLTDGLVFGATMISLNVLLDRRTKA